MSMRSTDGGLGLLFAASAFCAAAAWAGEPVTVVQKDREFGTKKVSISAGDTVRFTNEDEFLHQVYASSDRFSFDSAEQFPGDVVDVVFPQSGSFQVRCGIHPKMLMTVDVE